MSWLIIPEYKLDDEERVVVQSNYSNSHFWLVPCIGSNMLSLLLTCIKKLIFRYSGERKICLIVNNEWVQRTVKKQFLETDIKINVLTPHQFACSKTNYNNTFVLHGEDISKSIFDLIVKRSQFVFYSANPNLSIGNVSMYDNFVVASEDDISNALNVRKFELHFFHKSKNLILPIKKLITSNLFEVKRDFTATYTPIRICKATNNCEEVKYIQNEIYSFSNAGYEVALLFKSREDIVSYFNILFRIDGKQNWNIVKDRFDQIDVSSLESYLHEKGYRFLLSPFSDYQEESAVSVITYEEVKGIAFDVVILPFFDNQLCNEVEMDMVNKLMVHSIISAKHSIYFTYSHFPNDFLRQIESDCWQILIDNNKPPYNRSNIFGI